MTRFSTIALLAISAVALHGCANTVSDGGPPDVGPTTPTSGNNNPAGSATPNNSFRALFVPASGVLPYPSDAYFLGSTDGTLNIPAGPLFPNTTQVNKLDGFSTTASSYVRFSEPLDVSSATAASVRVVEATMLRDAASGVYAPVGVRRVLAQNVDYTLRLAPEADSANTVLEIVPLKPLTSSIGTGTGVGYVVLVTNGIRNTSGIAAAPDTDFATVRAEALSEITRAGTNPTFVPTCPGITNATLNATCKLAFAHLRIGGALPAPATISPTSVVVAYSFTTESTRYELAQLVTTTTAQPITARPTGLTTKQLVAALPGIASLYAGSLQIPYYLTPPSVADPTGPLTKNWTAAGPSAVAGIDPASRDITRFNPLPAKVADLKVPLLITVPNANSPGGGVKPAGGWPVVIFIHGITRDRSDAVAIADAYAAQGFVVVAMDQVLHGVTSTANPLYAGPANPAAAVLYGATTRERTFDVDYLNNTTGATGPDGVIDSSGASVINLSFPLVVRDNGRQMGSDLATLAKSLANLDLNGDTVGDVDMNRIHFAGTSLGAITGSTCICAEVRSFYMNVPGGPLPQILRDSPSFRGRINAGLAAVNPLLQPGTSLYAQFFRELQQLWDGGDPMNYIAALAQSRPVLITKVVGDTVVINSTNDNLIRAAGVTKVSTPGLTPIAAGAGKTVTFIIGSHGSLLDPTASLAVTTEMQTQAVSLAASGGAAFQVVNGAILEP
jgi:hypothetical protein